MDMSTQDASARASLACFFYDPDEPQENWVGQEAVQSLLGPNPELSPMFHTLWFDGWFDQNDVGDTTYLRMKTQSEREDAPSEPPGPWKRVVHGKQEVLDWYAPEDELDWYGLDCASSRLPVEEAEERFNQRGYTADTDEGDDWKSLVARNTYRNGHMTETHYICNDRKKQQDELRAYVTWRIPEWAHRNRVLYPPDSRDRYIDTLLGKRPKKDDWEPTRYTSMIQDTRDSLCTVVNQELEC